MKKTRKMTPKRRESRRLQSIRWRLRNPEKNREKQRRYKAKLKMECRKIGIKNRKYAPIYKKVK